MKKKIIYICRRFTLDKWGGTETVVINSAKQLEALGYEVEVFCTKALCSVDEEIIEGIKIRRFDYCLPWFGLSSENVEALLKKGGSLLSLQMLWALLKEKDVALIHVHVARRVGAIGRTAARIKGIPYVISLHGGWYNVPKEQKEMMEAPFKGKFEWGKVFGWLLGSRRVIEDANAIICVGKDEYELVRKKFPEKRVAYLSNGVNVDYFKNGIGKNFREKYEINENDKIFLCVSRIDFQKNQIFLVETFPEILKKDPAARLVFIGPVTVEDYFQRLKEKVKTLGLEDKVLIITGLSPQDPMMRDAYKACDYFVFATLHEPFGIVILEAWSAGKPVVASGIGGILGFTEEGKDCLQFDPLDKEDFLSKIFLLSENHELANRLSRNGFQEVSRAYDWSMVIKKLANLYEELLND